MKKLKTTTPRREQIDQQILNNYDVSVLEGIKSETVKS